jgi:hypothetical protein
MVSGFVGKQVCHLNMSADMEDVLLTVFCLFVEFQVAYCRVGAVGWYCICPEIVIVGVRRVCCRLYLLSILTCTECLMGTYFCHILILAPLLRSDMVEAVTLLAPTLIGIVDWFQSPLVEALEHSMLQS